MNYRAELHFDEWVAKARQDQLDDHEIARLAEGLAATGERLKRRIASADLASTGGPGSIATLWAPPAIVALGMTVAKLGVPGRPAGGIDVLMQIDGYRADLDGVDAERVLERCGYVHLLAGSRFAPADAAMFSYRQQVNAQNIPALAIASLLSKKLVTGTAIAGLEVRVAPHGNFGPDLDGARLNARTFCRVAGLLGLEAMCFLTDGRLPQQPYLGRGEALAALSHLLNGTECGWLGEHTRRCEEWAGSVAGGTVSNPGGPRRALTDNVTAQGGNIDSLHERGRSVLAAHSRTVTANREGAVSYDLGGLRASILAARGPDQGAAFDDSAGLVLLARPGSTVSRGEPLVSVRSSEAAWPDFSRGIAAAITIGEAGDREDIATGDAQMEIIVV